MMPSIIVEFREWTMWLAELGILWILIKEYWYDKEIFEAVLLRKMITRRRVRKVTEKVINDTLGIKAEEKVEDKSHAEISKNL
jgi:hypothetical protein